MKQVNAWTVLAALGGALLASASAQQVKIQIGGGDPIIVDDMGKRAPAPVKTPDKEPAPLPEKLKPFAELRNQAAVYKTASRHMDWRTVYTEEFKKDAKPTWRINQLMLMTDEASATEEQQAASLKQEKIEDRDVLVFDAAAYSTATIDVGPKVSGEYIIEMTAASLGAQPADLSIFCGTANPKDDTGVQFGAQMNQRNTIWAGPAPQPDGLTISVPIPARGPKIETGRFYKVRLEVKDGGVAGYIDDKPIGQARLGVGYDAHAQQQPMIYTFANKIAIDNVTIKTLVPVPAAKPDDAWKTAFGERKPEEIRKQIDALAELLGDEEADVRTAAGEQIEELGELAIPSLEAIVKDSGLVEQVNRAKALLRKVRETSAATTAPAAAPGGARRSSAPIEPKPVEQITPF